VEKISRVTEPISRVKCVVDTCYYYQSGDKCMAEQIEVKPPNSSSTEETDCNTFKPKQRF
jgi:hypothetical protein